MLSKSFICLEPIAGFKATKKNYSFYSVNQEEVYKEAVENQEVFDEFKKFVDSFELVDNHDLPFNMQGLWGYSSFESVEYMEDIDMRVTRSSLKDNPDLLYHYYKFVLVFDHFKKLNCVCLEIALISNWICRLY